MIYGIIKKLFKKLKCRLTGWHEPTDESEKKLYSYKNRDNQFFPTYCRKCDSPILLEAWNEYQYAVIEGWDILEEPKEEE